MSYNIEEMRRDGVSENIIQIAQAGFTLFDLILRNIENGSLFTQFSYYEDYEKDGMKMLAKYAAAAGLITRDDAKWLADDNNPYIIEKDPEVIRYLEAIPEEGDENGFSDMEQYGEFSIKANILDINVTITVETSQATGDKTVKVSNIHYNDSAEDPTAEVPSKIATAITNTIQQLSGTYIETFFSEPEVTPQEEI